MRSKTLTTHHPYKLSPKWVLIWVFIFALILFLSIFAPTSNFTTLVKLGSIVLCLFYAARTFPHDHLLFAAMLSTCIADIILASNNTAPSGVIIFLITQFLHLYRLNNRGARRAIVFFFVYTIAILLLNILFKLAPLLFLASGLYVLVLSANIIACARWCHHEPSNSRARIALAGFITFACCDFCTGLSYFALISILPISVYAPANVLVWLFYYISQVLLSNTGEPHPHPRTHHCLSSPHRLAHSATSHSNIQRSSST